MTAAPPAAGDTGQRHLAVGSRGFIAVLSFAMATTALGIDSLLPAYDDIRESLGLSPDASEITGIITLYFLGASLGLLPAGLLADRFGRRAVMWGGLAVYFAGAIGSMFASSLGVMLATRFVWGLGSAGPRVAALAMVRDGFAGAQMARVMSFVMAIFLLVPAVAPALAAGILLIGSWKIIVGLCAAAAVAVAALVTRLDESLPVESRRPLSARGAVAGYRTVLSTPGTGWFLVSLTALFAAFMSYLATSELIMDQTYDLAAWFPAFFGGMSLVALAAMVLNGRIVERVGLRRLVAIVFAGNIGSATAMLAVALATGGRPPFGVFVALTAAVLFSTQMLVPNVNSSAMLPLAAVAGTGAAVLNMVSGAVGAVASEALNQRFDGTITPLSFGFATASLVAAAAWWRADRAAARHGDA